MKRLIKLWSGIKNFFYFFNSLKNLFQKKEKNMALKDTWVNKVDGVDISSANDINEVAQAVIDLENESGSRPDFAANEGEKGFIKNRTHYIDKDGKVHTLPIEFIPEGVAKEKYVDDSLKALFVPRRLSEMVSDKYHRTVSDEEKEKWNAGGESVLEEVETYTANDTIVIPQQSLSSGMWMNRKQDIEPGIPYAVYIGGKEYFCIAGNEDGTIYLGNPKLFDSASTQAHNNEPFCITWAGGAATAGMFFKDATLSYPITLKVTGAAVTTENKLPEKYLPDGVAMKSDIPEGGGGANIDVVASVGQTIVVEKVDAEGKPTKWKAADYQERTHWSEEGIGDIVPLTTFTPILYEAFGCTTYPLVPFKLEIGKTYTVIFDGVEYSCTATTFAISAANMEGVYIGNPVFSGGGNNGMPFAVADIDQRVLVDGVATPAWTYKRYYALCMDTEQHTVQVVGEKTTYNKIPDEYVEGDFVVEFGEDTDGNMVMVTPWEEIADAVKTSKNIYGFFSGESADFDAGYPAPTFVRQNFTYLYSKVGREDNLKCTMIFLGTNRNGVPSLLRVDRDKNGVTTIILGD